MQRNGRVTAKKVSVQKQTRDAAIPRPALIHSAVLNSLAIETVPIFGIAVAIIVTIRVVVAIPGAAVALPSFDAPVPVPIQARPLPSFDAPIAVKIRATVPVPPIIAPVTVSVMIVIQFTTD
jgi:hypothetical protein